MMQDVSLEGSDPVVWLAFGVTHVVRVEDFPVMPVETTGELCMRHHACLLHEQLFCFFRQCC
jgi:Cu2+-containing amine oxidase